MINIIHGAYLQITLIMKLKVVICYKRKVEKNNEYVEQIFLNDIPMKNYPTPISEFSSMTYQEAKLYFFENDLRTIKSLIKKCKNPKLRAKHVSYEIYRNLLKKKT